MEELLALASGYGFPMVIAIYLLVRIEPLIKGLKQSVDTLTLIVAMQKDIKVDDFNDFKEKIENTK